MAELDVSFMKKYKMLAATALAVLTVTIAASAGRLPSSSQMHSLAMKAANGDRKAVDAMQELYDQTTDELIRHGDRNSHVDFSRELRAIFDEVGRMVRQPGESDPAFLALLYASAKDKLTSYAAGGLGTAAARGHQPSLEILLNHYDYGILLSSTVFALQKPAEARNQAAIEFLIAVIDDDKKKPLWSAATKGLRVAALEGNSDAQSAIQKYADYKINK